MVFNATFAACWQWTHREYAPEVVHEKGSRNDLWVLATTITWWKWIAEAHITVPLVPRLVWTTSGLHLDHAQLPIQRCLRPSLVAVINIILRQRTGRAACSHVDVSSIYSGRERRTRDRRRCPSLLAAHAVCPVRKTVSSASETAASSGSSAVSSLRGARINAVTLRVSASSVMFSSVIMQCRRQS